MNYSLKTQDGIIYEIVFNIDEGTFDEAMQLINLAKERVKKEFDIELELEIEVI